MGVRAAFNFDMKRCQLHIDNKETCLLLRPPRPFSLVLESLGASGWSVVEHSGYIWCGRHRCSLLFHPPHPTNVWLGRVADTTWLWYCILGRSCKGHGMVLTLFFSSLSWKQLCVRWTFFFFLCFFFVVDFRLFEKPNSANQQSACNMNEKLPYKSLLLQHNLTKTDLCMSHLQYRNRELKCSMRNILGPETVTQTMGSGAGQTGKEQGIRIKVQAKPGIPQQSVTIDETTQAYLFVMFVYVFSYSVIWQVTWSFSR